MTIKWDGCLNTFLDIKTKCINIFMNGNKLQYYGKGTILSVEVGETIEIEDNKIVKVCDADCGFGLH